MVRFITFSKQWIKGEKWILPKMSCVHHTFKRAVLYRVCHVILQLSELNLPEILGCSLMIMDFYCFALLSLFYNLILNICFQ